MKIDMNRPIVGLDGKVVPKPDSDEDATLGFICMQALLAPVGQEVKADQKIKQFRLSQKIVATVDGNVDISSEEITLLKNLVGDIYTSPALVGTVHDMLDPAD